MARERRVIGLLLIAISIAGLVVWEKWGKQQFLYDDVLVLRENVEKGTIITETMLTAEKMDVHEDYITFEEKEQLIGKQTAAFVHKGVPLFEEYFQEVDLSPSEKRGTYVLSLPPEWILSKPETLSRGDKVFFFYKENLVTSAFVSGIGTDGVINVIVTQNQTGKLSKIVSDGGKLVLVYQ